MQPGDQRVLVELVIMTSSPVKEACSFCSRNINIGQPFGECNICGSIIHSHCYNKSNFKTLDNMLYCIYCYDNNECEQRYCLLKSTNSKDNENFYNEEPSDIIDSIKHIESILSTCNMYTASEINDFKIDDNYFSNLFLNIDGNRSNFDSFLTEIKRFDKTFSVIGLAETNIFECNKGLYEIPGYNSCYQSKNGFKHSGSGVALYIHNTYNFVVNQKISTVTDNLEAVFVNITNTEQPITVGTLYRPPNGNKAEFINEFNNMLSNMPKHKVFLMGDFNMDLLCIDNNHTAEYEDSIITSGFAPLISIYTHEKPNCKKTCIDNILTNEFEDIIKIGTISDKLSHHLPVFQFSKLSNPKDKEDNDKMIQYYDYSNSNLDKFNELLSPRVQEFQDYLASTNETCDETFDMFTTMFKTTLDEACKLNKPKVTKRNHENNPWITPSIIASVNKKHDMLRKWKKSINRHQPSGNTKQYEDYKQYRRHLKSIIKWAKASYYNKQFENHEGDLKKTWKLINTIRGKTTRSIKPLFIIDNQTVTDRRIIADKFNKYFGSIASEMNSSVTETLSMDNGIPIINIPTFESYLGTSSSKNSIFLEDCSQDEICSIIHDFDNSKASDIPIRVIKKSVKVISPLLSYLYNNCMIKGIFPEVLKVGKISPMYKKGNAELLENYRPVSTLPIFGKIFEKIIYSRLYKFCISQNILHKSQFGFRKRHSTCHAINYSVEEIAKYLNNDKHTIGIFIDLSKAFDTINHNKLLRKLSFYGIRGIPHSLISSYLSNRKQFTSVLGEESSLITVEFGVPQGSVLGPLLFLLYINDLIKCSRDASFVLFADDTNIFVTGNTKDEAFITANIVLKSVQHYGWYYIQAYARLVCTRLVYTRYNLVHT